MPGCSGSDLKMSELKTICEVEESLWDVAETDKLPIDDEIDWVFEVDHKFTEEELKILDEALCRDIQRREPVNLGIV